VLTSYLTQTQALLQNPNAPAPLYAPGQLETYINSARGQLAGESKAIRFMGVLSLVTGQQVYPFTAISLAGSSGIQGILDVEIMWYQLGSGQKWIRPRGWPWFSQYELNTPVPSSGPPAVWAQYGQGAEAQAAPNPVGGGSLYVSPLPDQAYTVNVDCVCYPIPLVDDTTPEAIPYLWTDCVPYFAAYLALLSAQTGARVQDAQRMMELYSLFVQRARGASTPLILPTLYPQQQNPVRQNQLGVSGQPG